MNQLPSLLSALVVIGCCVTLLGCDRDQDSPAVTVGGAPQSESQTDPAPDEAPTAPEPDLAPTAPDQADSQVDYDPELPAGTAEQQSLFTEARTAFLLDEYEKAERLFDALAFDEPVTGETISAAIALGQIYIETGRPEQALELFNDLQDHVQDIPEVLLVLARVYADLDHPELALQAYDRAYEEQPDYIFILPEMAHILLESDQEEEAKEILMRYEDRLERMALKLEDPEQTPDRMRLYLVDILGLLHDERAHQALEAALLDDPQNAIRQEAANALGELAVFDAEDTLRKAATEDDAEAVRAAARRSLQSLREMRQQLPESPSE